MEQKTINKQENIQIMSKTEDALQLLDRVLESKIIELEDFQES